LRVANVLLTDGFTDSPPLALICIACASSNRRKLF
jgi:hypothetical protein